MAEKSVVIRNRQGIHCRPSAVIIKHIEGFKGTVRVRGPDGVSDCRQILSLMALGLDHGTEVTVSVKGDDAERVCDELAALFEKEFDFPPRAPGEPVKLDGLL